MKEKEERKEKERKEDQERQENALKEKEKKEKARKERIQKAQEISKRWEMMKWLTAFLKENNERWQKEKFEREKNEKKKIEMWEKKLRFEKIKYLKEKLKNKENKNETKSPIQKNEDWLVWRKISNQEASPPPPNPPTPNSQDSTTLQPGIHDNTLNTIENTTCEAEPAQNTAPQESSSEAKSLSSTKNTYQGPPGSNTAISTVEEQNSTPSAPSQSTNPTQPNPTPHTGTKPPLFKSQDIRTLLKKPKLVLTQPNPPITNPTLPTSTHHHQDEPPKSTQPTKDENPKPKPNNKKTITDVLLQKPPKPPIKPKPKPRKYNQENIKPKQK